jgi:hypothetical protein
MVIHNIRCQFITLDGDLSTSSRLSSTAFFSIFSFSHSALKLSAVSSRMFECDVVGWLMRSLSVRAAEGTGAVAAV